MSFGVCVALYIIWVTNVAAFKKKKKESKIINIKWYKMEKSPCIWDNIYGILWPNVWIALHSCFADKTPQSQSIYTIFINAECWIFFSQTENSQNTYLRVQNYINTITETLWIKIIARLQRAPFHVSHAASVTVKYVHQSCSIKWPNGVLNVSLNGKRPFSAKLGTHFALCIGFVCSKWPWSVECKCIWVC